MSAGLVSTRGLAARRVRASTNTRPVSSPYVRPPAWLALPVLTDASIRFVGLHAVYPDSNFVALSAAGDYTVDWGDGSSAVNVATGVQANYQYDFTTAALAGTNAPVTLQDTGDTVTRTAHGHSNGATVRFYNLVSTTGVSENTPYFVISATANTFQVSLTLGGSAIALTTDGSATLLPYRQAIVSVTMQAAQTFTSLNLFLPIAADF
jgi:hypothetical protein